MLKGISYIQTPKETVMKMAQAYFDRILGTGESKVIVSDFYYTEGLGLYEFELREPKK